MKMRQCRRLFVFFVCGMYGTVLQAQDLTSKLNSLEQALVGLEGALKGPNPFASPTIITTAVSQIKYRDLSEKQLGYSGHAFYNRENINLQDANGDTLLIAVIKLGFNKLAKTLVRLASDYFIDLNARDKDGNTPLIAAAMYIADDNVLDVNYYNDLFQQLIVGGADKTLKNNNNFTAWAFAYGTGNNKIANLLKIKKTPPTTPQKPEYLGKYATFKEWDDACKNLPLHKEDKGYQLAKGFDYEEFLSAFEAYRDLVKKTIFTDSSKWLNGTMPKGLVQDPTTDTRRVDLQPFVERLILKKGDKVALHGDWHGDIQSLLKFIKVLQGKGFIETDSFKIVDPNFYIVFLGDYVDRGIYSVEVVYTLIRLKLANPDKVFLPRGNHEHIDIASKYGLYAELDTLFENKQRDRLFNCFHNWFNQLPFAVFVGCQAQPGKAYYYVQCCHGGIEIGYDPKPFLGADQKIRYEFIQTLAHMQNAQKIGTKLTEDLNKKNEGYIYSLISGFFKNTPNKKYESYYDFFISGVKNIPTSELGFAWTDFFVDDNKFLAGGRGGNTVTVGKQLTQDYLTFASNDNVKLRGILRSHQHTNTFNEMMQLLTNKDGKNPLTPGVARLWRDPTDKAYEKKLWPGIVATFNIAPNTYYGSALGFTNDTWALLEPNALPGHGIETWKMEVFQNK